MRHRCDEVGAHLLEGTLLREVAERVHGARVEAHRRERQPELTVTEVDGDGLRTTVDSDRHDVVVVPGKDLARVTAERVALRDPGHRLRRVVPQEHELVLVEEDDAVGDRLERARRARPVLDLLVELSVLDHRRRPVCELLRRAQIALAEAPARLAGDESDRAERAPAPGDRHADERPKPELLEQAGVRLVGRKRGDRRRLEVGEQPAARIADRRSGPGDMVGARRMLLPELLRKAGLRGIAVLEGEGRDRPVLLRHVDRAPVGDPRHREPRDRREARTPVEGARELGAGVQQEVLRLLDPLAVVDVRRGADPEVD